MSIDPSDQSPSDGQYVVVARRYRPRDFEELVGQRQVSTALANAINTNRVGHAYLFTGARGVGKTSTARILAKCLNCVEGPTPTPCGRCDSCLSIAAGEDVDVLEIDGASNRGIDEIRQLRSNVNIRPSRSRYKVYIIDEVHMLTTAAFNALLKTLEEPPEHVKFIFCTTDPEKIPITVISRCQRFDFAGIQTDSIIGRLRHIVEQEQVNVSDDALTLLARRAGGSMRDSQSLLEQLLAFGGENITVDEVHALLGTAGGGRIWRLVDLLIAKDAAAALGEFDAALGEGADAGQVIEQLAGCFRDLLVRLVGCPEQMLLNTGQDELPQLDKAASELGLTSVLAAMQLLDEALLRMRQSTQARMVAEAAIVRICCLEQLESLAAVIGQLRTGALKTPAPRPVPSQPAQKKTAERSLSGQRVDPPHRSEAPRSAAAAGRPTSSAPHSPAPSAGPAAISSAPSTEPTAATATAASPRVEGLPLNAANLTRIWEQTLKNLDGMTQQHAARCAAPAISGPNRLAIRFPATYTSSKAYCERPQQRQELASALQKVVGQSVRIDFSVIEGGPAATEPARPKISQVQLKKQVMADPLVQAAAEIFDAAVVAVEPPARRVSKEEG